MEGPTENELPSSQKKANQANPNRTPEAELTGHGTQSISPAPFIVPLVVFMVLSMLAPSFEFVPDNSDGTISAVEMAEVESYTALRNETHARNYTFLVIGQVLVGFSLLAYFRKSYFRQFPLKLSLVWAVGIGVVGCALWVAIAKLGVEHEILKTLGLESWMPKRVGFNPFGIESDGSRILFLVFRFLVLAALVPVIEELFLRGWLIRYIENDSWWQVTLASLSLKACSVATLYGVLTHPGEILAAIVWFTLVTLMMKRTGNFWDCVVAHAVTNLLLGIWVMYSGDWFLW